ncbi:MAG: N-acetylglutamate synthase related acetyltransferase [uncultured archaeon A07HR60]|nr:MAG: N-acetylglutamate synthase related acetyltransferase [uncultured archaeon A07HR60]
MRVRPACPDDSEVLRAAVAKAKGNVLEDAETPVGGDFSVAGVCEAAACDECGFVAEADNKCVGFAFAHPDSEGGEAELNALWVHPAYRNTEVEDELLGRIAAGLADGGINQLRAAIDVGNDVSHEFYQSRGFDHRTERTAPEGTRQRVVVAPVESLR